MSAPTSSAEPNLPERRSGPQAASLPELCGDFLNDAQLFRRYSRHTVLAYDRDLSDFANFIAKGYPEVDATEITSAHVTRWITSLSRLAPASICRKLDALSSFFAYLVRSGTVAANPVAQVPRPRRPRPLVHAASTDDVRALLAAAETPTEQLFIALLSYAGLRRSEALGLSVGDFSPDLSRVRVRGKGAKERELPVAVPLQELLHRHVPDGSEACRPVLPNQAGSHMGGTTAQRMFRRLLRRAGLPDVGLTIHSLRHYFATELIRCGCDVATLQRLMGHAHASSTLAYLHADQPTMRAAVDRLPDMLRGPLQDGMPDGSACPEDAACQPSRASP